MDLKKKYPNYFKRWIFNFAIALIFLLVVTDYHLNGNSFYSISFKCDTRHDTQCVNPLYDCAHYGAYSFTDMPCTRYTDSEFRTIICVDGICDKQYVPDGFSYGRQDWLYKNNVLLILAILVIAFTVNHILYVRRKKK